MFKNINSREFDKIIDEHNIEHEEEQEDSTVLRKIVEKRMKSHRSSNPKLHFALRRLHRLRQKKKEIEKEIEHWKCLSN
jgi:transcription elongation GreA/GreB family factor